MEISAFSPPPAPRCPLFCFVLFRDRGFIARPCRDITGRKNHFVWVIGNRNPRENCCCEIGTVLFATVKRSRVKKNRCLNSFVFCRARRSINTLTKLPERFIIGLYERIEWNVLLLCL